MLLQDQLKHTQHYLAFGELFFVVKFDTKRDGQLLKHRFLAIIQSKVTAALEQSHETEFGLDHNSATSLCPV